MRAQVEQRGCKRCGKPGKYMWRGFGMSDFQLCGRCNASIWRWIKTFVKIPPIEPIRPNPAQRAAKGEPNAR